MIKFAPHVSCPIKHEDKVPLELRRKRIELLLKCQQEDRDLTSEEKERLEFVNLDCANCSELIMVIGKECLVHVNYQCMNCNYQRNSFLTD